MPAIAKLRYQRLSPQKARLVADVIRGKDALEALNILRFTNKKDSSINRKNIKICNCKCRTQFRIKP